MHKSSYLAWGCVALINSTFEVFCSVSWGVQLAYCALLTKTQCRFILLSVVEKKLHKSAPSSTSLTPSFSPTAKNYDTVGFADWLYHVCISDFEVWAHLFQPYCLENTSLKYERGCWLHMKFMGAACVLCVGRTLYLAWLPNIVCCTMITIL